MRSFNSKSSLLIKFKNSALTELQFDLVVEYREIAGFRLVGVEHPQQHVLVGLLEADLPFQRILATDQKDDR